MLVRIGLAKQGRVTTVPTVAVMVALLGATGLLVGLAAATMIVVRGTELASSDVPPMVGLFAFFGVSSLVMTIAGSFATRSGRLAVWRDEEMLRWRSGTEEGSMSSARASVAVRKQGFGNYRHFSVELTASDTQQRVELGGSVLESVAKSRQARFSRALGLS